MSKPSVQAPQQRDLGSELLQTYYGTARTAQPYFNLESYYQPKYGQLQLSNMQQQLFGYNVPNQPAAPPQGAPGNTLKIPQTGKAAIFRDPYSGANTPSQTPGYHPGTLALGAAANTFNRASDVSDIARLGLPAQQAFLHANPFLAASLSNLSGRLEDSPILRLLNSQAEQGLAQGGQLSPQEQAAADQQSLAASSAAGMAHGNPAIAAQILNRDAAVRARAAAAQQFASGVQGLNQNQGDLVGRASQIFSTTLSDPFQAILGRSSGAGGGAGGGGYPQQIGTGARLFDPTNPYAQDIYNTNYNAQASANIANANNQAAGQNAGIGAVGSILGGALIAY